MKNWTLSFGLLILGVMACFQVQAQDNEDKNMKYKAIQGLGYLHTQTTMIIDHWDTHMLNHKPMDEHEKEFQDHMRKELEHDEEWAEYMMVEDNLMNHFSLKDNVKSALNANLSFYHEVIHLLNDPDGFSEKLEDLKTRLGEADKNIYEVIYPALCK
ncbi:MAG: hypothetical protein MK212_16125 [Saprospiraceae bacterium]|nr:hypothetical protein [Saprospiraceae bacterium]